MPSSVLQARSLPTESCRFLSLSSWKHKCQQTGPVQFWLNNQLVSSREGPTYSVEKGITCKGRSGQFLPRNYNPWQERRLFKETLVLPDYWKTMDSKEPNFGGLPHCGEEKAWSLGAARGGTRLPGGNHPKAGSVMDRDIPWARLLSSTCLLPSMLPGGLEPSDSFICFPSQCLHIE